MKIAFFSMNPLFAGHILAELNQHHTVKQWRYNQIDTIGWSSMMKLIDWADLTYLEWLQRPNLEVTQVQGLDKPIVAFCHGMDVANHAGVEWKNIAGLIIQDANYPRLLDLRTEWAAKFSRPLPKLPRKTLIQSLGVDLNKFPPLPEPITPEYHIIAHAMWIRPVKRIYELIQTFYDLLQTDGEKPWKLTLVGEWESTTAGTHNSLARDEYMRACRELITQLKFPPGRFFLKQQNFSHQIWPQFSREADIYWCTSYRESFGVSMAEACAGGAYPLINHYSGADKVYPKKHLCKTPAEMVRKTIAWGNLSNEEKVQERKVIRSHIEQYDARKAAKNIRLFLEEVQEGYRKR